jgi:branched-chain amino acid transport system permease protein
MDPITLALQQTVNGLTLGSLYALIALGLALIFGVLEMLHFAHGEVYMIGGFAAVGVAAVLLGVHGVTIPPILVVGVMFIAAMAIASVLGVAIERVAYRPVRNLDRLAPIITGIGVSYILRNIAQMKSGGLWVPVQASALVPQTNLHIGSISAPFMAVVLIVVSLFLMLALDAFVFRTTLGAAIRATAQDREAAGFIGINIEQVIFVTFILASALAGASGALFALRYGGLDSQIGFLILIKGFAATVIGGIGNLRGAMFGGLLLGVLESLVGGFISTAFQDTFVFVLVIVVLLIRPWGLFGERPLERA